MIKSEKHGPRRKHSLSVVQRACFLIRFLAVNVLLSRAYASTGMYLPNRCQAVDLYVTIQNSGVRSEYFVIVISISFYC
jgi:hypothetical protein